MLSQFFQKNVSAISVATSVTAVFLAVLIIAAEEFSGLKNWLKLTFTHHWLGKGALAIVIFLVTSAALGFLWKDREQEMSSVIRLVIIETIAISVSALALLVFFFWHASK